MIVDSIYACNNAALHFSLAYCTIGRMATSNFDRFSALLTSQQLQAMGRVCAALQDDPTCFDTHRSGCDQSEREDKKEDTSNGYI